jgi:hypothetical protein
MACTSGSSFLLSAADVTWVRKESTCVEVTTNAVAAEEKYFLIDAPASHGGAVSNFFVWFDLDGASTAPVVSGRTAIEVDVVTGDTTILVASKLAAALEAHALFKASVNPDDTTHVLIKTLYGGPVSIPTTDGDTTFNFTQ